MRWCADNIARFGGDPKRVFIAGQSAGGEAIGEHLVRPKSWGLFSAAGLESGAFYRMSPPTAASARLLLWATCGGARRSILRRGDHECCRLFSTMAVRK